METWCRTGLVMVVIISLAAAPLVAVADTPAPAPRALVDGRSVTERGPELLDLPALLEEARHVNPEILAARKRWEALRAKIPQATGLPAPRVGIEVEEIPRGTVRVNQATLIYQLIQALPFPGKLSLRGQVAVKEAQQAAMAFKQVEWDVTALLTSTYDELWLLDRELEIQQQQLLWLQPAAAVAQARYATGAAPQAELLRAQAAAVDASNAIMVFTHHRRAMAAHLNHLLNRPAHQTIGRPGPIPLHPVPSSPEALFAQALEHQPELLAARFSSERAEAAWRLAKRERWPDLETMVALRDPAMGPIGPWDLTLALVLPFWFWTKQQYGVKAALFDTESAQAAYRAMQNEVARRIHEHWHEASAAHGTAVLCSDYLIPLGRQAVASALAAYQGGRGSLPTVLEALQQLSEQERRYDQQLVTLEQHRVMLEQAVGLPLDDGEAALTAGGGR